MAATAAGFCLLSVLEEKLEERLPHVLEIDDGGCKGSLGLAKSRRRRIVTRGLASRREEPRSQAARARIEPRSPVLLEKLVDGGLEVGLLFYFYQAHMANYWIDYKITLVICFSNLTNHKIWQVNFGKLLEMLYPLFRNKLSVSRYFSDLSIVLFYCFWSEAKSI